MLAIVDAGPLYAVADSSDRQHSDCLSVFERTDLHFVIAAFAVAEASYLLGRHAGASSEAAFLLGLAGYDVEAPAQEDWPRIAELVEQYADFPLGGADASVVALAERLQTPLVITLDHRHFSAVQPRHCDALELLPNRNPTSSGGGDSRGRVA